jgi:F-type H+-transporting ATPase subunit delta
MKSTKVASRYAKSLLEIALEQKNVDSVLGDMKFLLNASEGSKDFEMLVSSPIINASKKIEIFEKIFEQFETVSMDFIKLITNNSREEFLIQIARSFEAQVKEYKGIVPITIISATSLDAATKAKIVAKVQETVKGELEIEEKIDASLIGGFVVRMGDMQIDASIANQFNNLKQRLTR